MHYGVFGASGFVGRNLLDELAGTGHKVSAFDVVPIDGLPPNAEFSKVDITDEESVMDVVKNVDVIAHLAAHQLPDSLDNPKLNAEVNIIGTLNILDAARKHDVEKVFFPSASSIIGSVDGKAAEESAMAAPRSPYGVAKHAVEVYLEVYNDLYGLNYLTFRFFNVYGPHQYPDSGAFVPTIMSRLANGQGVYVTGDGQQTRDFVYAGDVARFIIEGLERDDISNEVINMGYGREIALIDAIHKIGDVVGVDPDIDRRPAREDEIDNFCADMTKCIQLFGRRPTTRFESGLEYTYEWMQKELELGG